MATALDLLLQDRKRLTDELGGIETAIAALTRGKGGAAKPKGPKPAVADQPSKRSIIAGCVTGRNRPSLDVVMARLGEAGYPTDAKARVAASNDLSKLMKARKRK